jgi:predicted aspartyl protease
MAKTTETVLIKNLFDISKAMKFSIMISEIRSKEIEAVVDTNSAYLCLPPKVIAELGLTYDSTKTVSTSNGNFELRIFKDVEINFMDRSIEMQVIENKEDNNTASIGNLVLEQMNLVYDPKSEVITRKSAY